MRYAELVLGGRVNQAVLLQLVEKILLQKGPMPVGEVGKNLQAITGCDGLSRRLKEQYSGLKKAIELSGSHRLKVGTEHPFNPIVTLVEDSAAATDDGESKPEAQQVAKSAQPPFGHVSFVFTPLLAMIALTTSNVREAAAASAAQQSKVGSSSGSISGSRSTYRRPAPFFLETRGGSGSFDTMSVLSQSTRGTAAGGNDSQYIYNKRNQMMAGQRGKSSAPQSPNRYAGQQQQQQGGYRGNGYNAVGGQQGGGAGPAMMYAHTLDGVPGYVPVQHQQPQQQHVSGSMGSYVGSPAANSGPMTLYQQQQMHMAYLQQQQMYQNYAASCMAASSGTSLGSSYGGGGGLSASSPGGISYMNMAEQQNSLMLQQHLAAQQQYMQQQQQMQAAAAHAHQLNEQQSPKNGSER